MILILSSSIFFFWVNSKNLEKKIGYTHLQKFLNNTIIIIWKKILVNFNELFIASTVLHSRNFNLFFCPNSSKIVSTKSMCPLFSCSSKCLFLFKRSTSSSLSLPSTRALRAPLAPLTCLSWLFCFLLLY